MPDCISAKKYKDQPISVFPAPKKSQDEVKSDEETGKSDEKLNKKIDSQSD